jgi:rubrerythrin
MTNRGFASMSDIIAFAITREIEAAEGYGRMAVMAKMPGLRDLLLELKGEEENHRRLLENLTFASLEEAAAAPVPDMRLSDALADVTPAPDITLQDLLIFAARKEKKSEDLYRGLARSSKVAGHRKLFEFIAGQERAHKLKLETEYEKRVLSED